MTGPAGLKERGNMTRIRKMARATLFVVIPGAILVGQTAGCSSGRTDSRNAGADSGLMDGTENGGGSDASGSGPGPGVDSGRSANDSGGSTASNGDDSGGTATQEAGDPCTDCSNSS